MDIVKRLRNRARYGIVSPLKAKDTFITQREHELLANLLQAVRIVHGPHKGDISGRERLLEDTIADLGGE